MPALACLAASVVACGGAGRQVNSAAKSPPKAFPDVKAPTRGYLNDGDEDRVGDENGDGPPGGPDNGNDDDNDVPWDYKAMQYENTGYHDGDDGIVLKYGHPARVADKRAIATTVKRYYAAAAAGDGTLGCAQLSPSLAKALPLDYGKLGLAYAHGNTCQAVLSSMFAHVHDQMRAPVAVTGARIAGRFAYALLGSTTMPASAVTLERERSGWALTELLGGKLQ